MTIQELKATCTQVRRDIISMTTAAGSGHPGGSLSATEILVALYYQKMNIDPKDPKNMQRDRFVLSKGHAAPALYAVLGEKGYFSTEEFKNFRQIHSILQGHPDMQKCPGVDASTGSLGQGASIAVGMALGARKTGNPCHVYALLGDGECQEGLIWEACMAAAHYKLENLTFILDNNGLQIDGSNEQVMSLGDIHAKFDAFGFNVVSVDDGNDLQKVLDALDKPAKSGMPTCIICKTVKGKGVDFMENQVDWHGKAPNAEQCAKALAQLEV